MDEWMDGWIFGSMSNILNLYINVRTYITTSVSHVSHQQGTPSRRINSRCFYRETHRDHLLIRLGGKRFFPLAGNDGRRTPRLYWISCLQLVCFFSHEKDTWRLLRQIFGIYGIIVCVEYLASVSNWCFFYLWCLSRLLWGAAAREKKHVLTRAQRYRIPFWICFLKPSGKLT